MIIILICLLAFAPLGFSQAGQDSNSGRRLFVLHNSYGERWYANKDRFSNKNTLVDVETNIGMDWIPFDLPFSIGASYSVYDFSERSWESIHIDSRVSSFEWFGDVRSWFSAGSVVLFVRYKHTLAGQIRARDKFSVGGYEQEVEGLFEVIGSHLNFGMKYPILSAVTIFGEISHGVQMFEIKKIKLNGNEAPILRGDSRPEDFNSNAALVGLDVTL